MKKKVYSIIIAILIISNSISAVVNPEVILWRADDNALFVNTLYQGVLGRAPSEDEMADMLERITSQITFRKGRADAFWSLLASTEYKVMFGDGSGDYQVLFRSMEMDVEWSNRTWCHCYFYTEDPTLTGGHLAAMQYVGVQTPWGRYSFSVARAVQRMYAVYDPNSCPGLYCGMNQSDVNDYFGVDNKCPDLSGNWYRKDAPEVRVRITYLPDQDLFLAEIDEMGYLVNQYFDSFREDCVKLLDKEEYGYISDDIKNIKWTTGIEWNKMEFSVEGLWTMENAEFRIVQTGNGHFSIYIEVVGDQTLIDSGFKAGDLFGEMWTQDHIHFNGYFNTNLEIPRIDMYFKYENGVIHISPKEAVLYDVVQNTGKFERK
jgi:hypothetical protein